MIALGDSSILMTMLSSAKKFRRLSILQRICGIIYHRACRGRGQYQGAIHFKYDVLRVNRSRCRSVILSAVWVTNLVNLAVSVHRSARASQTRPGEPGALGRYATGAQSVPGPS